MTTFLEWMALSLIAAAFVVDVRLGLLVLCALLLTAKIISDFKAHEKARTHNRSVEREEPSSEE